MSKELKSCPFCGSNDVTMIGSRLWYAECDVCGAKSGQYGSRRIAAASWNARRDLPCYCYDTHEYGDFTCSVCGCVVQDTADENPTISLNGHYAGLNYCPHCGAKVVEE